jgi:hypothetical protein
METYGRVPTLEQQYNLQLYLSETDYDVAFLFMLSVS